MTTAAPTAAAPSAAAPSAAAAAAAAPAAPAALPDRFAALCKANPPPKLVPADLPAIPEPERAFLRQNAAGEILVASDALRDATDDTRHLLAAAIRKALDHVAAAHSVASPASHADTGASGEANAKPGADADADSSSEDFVDATSTASTPIATATAATTAPEDPNQLHTPDHNSPIHSAQPHTRADPLDPLPLTSATTTSPLTSPSMRARSSDAGAAANGAHHGAPATYDIDDDPPDGDAGASAAGDDGDMFSDAQQTLHTRLSDLSLDADARARHAASAVSSSPHGSPPASDALARASLLELLGQPRFAAIPRLSTFTWGSSHAKRELDAFNAETQRLARARAQSGAPSPQAAARKKRPSAAPPKHAADVPSPVDPVQLGAQEEAAAAAVLRDLRVANSRLRRPSFRPAETPVWAIVAQRGGRMKPEAAAEMARARVAAAAAAAVMREAGNGGDGDGRRGEDDGGAGDGPGGANGGANGSAGEAGSASQRGRHIDELDDDNFVRQNDRHEFFREYVSPRSRSYSSDAGLFPMHGGQLPATALTLDGVVRGKAGDKKRVAFAEDTVFSSK